MKRFVFATPVVLLAIFVAYGLMLYIAPFSGGAVPGQLYFSYLSLSIFLVLSWPLSLHFYLTQSSGEKRASRTNSLTSVFCMLAIALMLSIAIFGYRGSGGLVDSNQMAFVFLSGLSTIVAMGYCVILWRAASKLSNDGSSGESSMARRIGYLVMLFYWPLFAFLIQKRLRQL